VQIKLDSSIFKVTTKMYKISNFVGMDIYFKTWIRIKQASLRRGSKNLENITQP